MLARRIIPCLDVKDGRIVKGVNFVGLQDAGDPVEAAVAYQAAGADELVLLDITATSEDRNTFTDLVTKISEKLFIPFTVGGGIRTVDDVERVLNAGADKVGINSAAVKNPELVRAIADQYGSQSIVCAVDARKRENDEGWEIFVAGGKKATGLDAVEWSKQLEELGAGEILLTSMDRDGTRDGYDLELVTAIRNAVSIPIIASGGVGELEHLAEGIEAGANAVLAASIFHFGTFQVEEARDFLKARGIPVRPFNPERGRLEDLLDEK